MASVRYLFVSMKMFYMFVRFSYLVYELNKKQQKKQQLVTMCKMWICTCIGVMFVCFHCCFYVFPGFFHT